MIFVVNINFSGKPQNVAVVFSTTLTGMKKNGSNMKEIMKIQRKNSEVSFDNDAIVWLVLFLL